MFVRKGTVRKNRGAGRRQAHRHRRDSSEQSGASRKSVIVDDPSSNGSGAYGLSPSADHCSSRSVSMNSFTYGATLEPDTNVAEKDFIDNTLCNPYIHTFRKEDAIISTSPVHNYKLPVVVSFLLIYPFQS